MNKVILIGRLTRDAEVKQIENSERAVIRFTLAVRRDYSNKDRETETDFIPVVYWTNYAEKLYPYLVKGKLISVSGKLTVRNYISNDGIKKYVTEVEIDNIQFLGSKNERIV